MGRGGSFHEKRIYSRVILFLVALLLERDIDLQPNHEWSSDPFEVHSGRTLRVTATGTTRFYIAVVDLARWDQLRGPTSSHRTYAWPFSPGSDHQEYQSALPVRVGGPQRAVLRVGRFHPAGRIHISISED